MKLLVSVLMTRFDIMKTHWERNSVLARKGKVGTNRAIGREINLGGCLLEIDWSTKKILRSYRLSCPSGFVALEKQIVLIASMRENELYFFDLSTGNKRVLSHPHMNDLHSVNLSRRGIILANTGLDGILELSLDGALLWSWYAWQNGYALDQFGTKREIDLQHDQRRLDYPTLAQTTHLNSALEDPRDENIVYASLFHQGSIVQINKKTGRSCIVRANLRHCHSIRATNNGFSVANTRAAKIVLFDKTFRYQRSIPISAEWIQDAVESSKGTFFYLAANRSSIVEIDEDGASVDSLTLNPNWRLYQIAEILKSQ